MATVVLLEVANVRLLLLAAMLSLASCAAAPRGAECMQNQYIVTADGERLAADCYPGTRPALVFIHGWSQSRVVWQEQVETFAGSRMVVTYDLRGHGDSTRPTVDSAYLGEWTPAKDLESVLDRFGVNEAVLVGWSFGAIVASNAAVYLGPQRVKGLVLVSGAIESGTPRSNANFGPLFGKLAPMTTSGPIDEERAAVHRFIKESFRYGTWSRSLYEKVFAATMRLTATERSRVAKRPQQRFSEGINRSGIPVALVHGEDDPLLSVESSKQAHAELRNSSLVIYPGTGHWPFVERVSLFNADVLRFIDERIDQ